MVMTDEERKAYMKKYREDNKEKLAAQTKAYRQANKEKIAARQIVYNKNNKDKITAKEKAYRIANKEKINAYIHTDQGTKSNRMSNWRTRGVNNVTDELYHYYMNCDKCEVCGNEFTDKNWKCFDHNHETGDFRYVLCNRCNAHDNWKKVILNHTDNA